MGPTIEIIQLLKMAGVLIAGVVVAHYVLKYMDKD